MKQFTITHGFNYYTTVTVVDLGFERILKTHSLCMLTTLNQKLLKNTHKCSIAGPFCYSLKGRKASLDLVTEYMQLDLFYMYM